MVEIKITVKSVETTDEGTLVIEMSPYPYARWIQTEALADANVAVQPYGVIMVPEAATFTPGGLTVDVEVKGYIFSVPLATLMEADAEDQIEFISPYITVTDLADVDLTNLQNGQTLIWDATNNVWVNGSSGGSTLSALTDTTITSPTNGQALIYDSASSKWVNGSAGGGGSAEKWFTIFGDASDTLAPLETIEIESSGAPVDITNKVLLFPYIHQDVKVTVDNEEVQFTMTKSNESLIFLSNNSPLFVFQENGTVAAFLSSGTHVVSIQVKEIDPASLFLLSNDDGAGTAQSPNTLYDLISEETLDENDYLALITQCVPFDTGNGLSTTIGEKHKIVSWGVSYNTPTDYYKYLVGAGGIYYGVVKTGNQ